MHKQPLTTSLGTAATLARFYPTQELPMNGYLVLARTTYREVPMRLYATEAEAQDFADFLDPKGIMDFADHMFPLSAAPRSAQDEVVDVEVIEFRDGLVVKSIMVEPWFEL